MTEKNVEVTEEERTERVAKLGRPNGLYQECMKEIKNSHTIGQTLRSAALAAGALSDIDAYAELLGQFYVATDALERRMDEYIHEMESSSSSGSHVVIKTNSDGPERKATSIVKQVKSLAYGFREGYERDLEFLLGSDWKRICEESKTSPAEEYISRLRAANDVEIVAAAFILWGPLIIGGGAALKPRIKKSFGEGATHLFEDVVGNVKGVGRGGRRRKFIEVYDGLLDGYGQNEGDRDESRKKQTFDLIVRTAGEFMLLNNAMMLAVKKRPWWYKYVLAGEVLAIAAMIMRFLPMSK